MPNDRSEPEQGQVDSRLEALRLELSILQGEMATGSLTFPQALEELLTLAHSYMDVYLPLQKASSKLETF
jgi:uncharacterized membrane-anchored protein YhcB (DUF1043 family)